MSIEVLSVRGLRPECGKVDRDLWLWFCEAKKDSENYHGPRVTKRLVQAKAKQAFQAAGILNFKASDGWYIRWLKRWHRIGADNTKKLENQGIASAKKKEDSKMVKKRPSRKPKSKVQKVPEEAIISPNVTKRSACSSPVNVALFNSTSETTISDYFVQVVTPNSLSKMKEVSEHFNKIDPAQNTVLSPVDADNQMQIIDGDVNKDFMDSFFSKNHIIHTDISTLEQEQMDDSFAPHSLSLLNMEEIAWNGSSCFSRSEPSNELNQVPVVRNLDSIYHSESVSQTPELVNICPMNRKDIKHPSSEEKLLKLPKLTKPFEGNYLPNLALEMTYSIPGDAVLKKKDLVSSEKMSCSHKNSGFSSDTALGGTLDLICGKNLKDSFKNVNITNTLYVKNGPNFVEQVINNKEPDNHTLVRTAKDLSRHELKSNVFNTHTSPKSGSFKKQEFSGNASKLCETPSKKNMSSHIISKNSIMTGNLMVEGAANTLTGKNFASLINAGSVSDCTASSCETFTGDIMVQHDLEDVSVSSDFVNQLYDEHSFDLNLECENGLTHPMTRKVKIDSEIKHHNSYVSNECNVNQHGSNFVHRIPLESSAGSKCGFQSSGLVTASPLDADDDFSNDENDYISRAVLLSMQEDDFSILNCDQSPFQGTMSVIDENSQSENEKITDLERERMGVESSLPASVENTVGNTEIVFPVSCDLGKEVLCLSGDTFSKLNREENNALSRELIEDTGSQSILQVLNNQNYVNEHSILFQTQKGKGGEQAQEFLISSHSVGDNMLNELQSGVLTSLSVGDTLLDSSSNVLVTSLCSESEIMSHGQDILQVSSPLDGVSVIDSKGVFHMSPLVERNSMTETLKGLNLSSSGDTSVILEGQDVFQISSPMDEIAFVEAQDVFQISSPGSSNNTQDSFLRAHNSQEKVDMPQSLFSTANYSERSMLKSSLNILAPDGCFSSQKLEDTSSMYVVPCSPGEEVGSETATRFDVSNIILGNCLPGENSMDLFSLSSHNGSLSEVTIANADSTTLLLTQSPYLFDNDGASRLISLSSTHNNLVKNASLLKSPSISEVWDKKLDARVVSQVSPSCSVADVSESLQQWSSSQQVESSTRPFSSESSKENGCASPNLPSAECVLSAQEAALGSPLKPLSKNAVCLDEKGLNTTRGSSRVQENKAPFRRSSGDRYFPYFKERVANYAIKHTAKEAARSFGVNVDTVTMWTRGRYENDSVIRNYPDQMMLRWLKRSRESGIILTREQIVEKALQLLKTPGSWVKDKSRWFHVWASRLADEKDKKTRSNCDDKGVTPLPLDCGDKKALYPDEFKVEVVLYAEQTSKNLASSIFNIARKRVFEWSASLKVSKHAQEEQISSVSPSDHNINNKANVLSLQGTHPHSGLPVSLLNKGTMKLKLNGKGVGRAVTNATVDRELWEWFCEQTAKKSKPKSRDIRAKAVELFRAHNHDKIQCSHGWLKKWSLRYGIALRHEGDGDLLAWCLEQFDRNKNISHRDLLNQAHESLTGTHKSEFKASAGWLVRFCKRHHNLLSAKPTIDVEIPMVLKHSVSEFRTQVQQFIHSSRIPLESIGSMDEIPLNFTSAGSGGSRSRLLLRRSGLENCHATVVLSCLANGELLPPAVIFKGEGPTEQMIFDGVPLLILYEKDCCMSATIMLQWLDFIWIKNVPSPSVVVVDCFDPHCNDEVRKACSAANTSLSVIPAGCSFKLQPLDLAISRQFEANIYNRWTRHFTAVDQLSMCKRTLYSSNTDIARWIAEAFTNLKLTRKEAIRRSFIVTGLTTAMNGSEDHLLEDPTHIPFSSLFTS